MTGYCHFSSPTSNTFGNNTSICARFMSETQKCYTLHFNLIINYYYNQLAVAIIDVCSAWMIYMTVEIKDLRHAV